MASQLAKQQSAGATAATARAKAKKDDLPRRTVFRPVLANPLNVDWPTPSAAVRRELLDALLSFLTKDTEGEPLSIADWRLQEHARRRGRTPGAGKGKGKGVMVDGKKGKRGREEGGLGKQSKKTRKGVATVAAALEDDQDAMDTTPIATTSTLPTMGPTHTLDTRSSKTYTIPDFVDKSPGPKPALRAPLIPPETLSFVSVGINEVTRALETRIRWGRWELGDFSTAPPGDSPAAPAPSTNGGHRKRHTSARQVSALDPLAPTSTKTLARPSLRFLTMPTPVGLVQPEDPNPFFRLLAPPAPDRPANVNSLKQWAVAADLLKDVMEADDPAGARMARKELAKQRHADIVMDGGGPREDETIEAEPTTKTEPTTHKLPKPVLIIDLIFVCKPDINPPSLVAHLPTMTAAANGVNEAMSQFHSAATTSTDDGMDTGLEITSRMKKTVFLIPLDLGAEKELAAALGLRRVATLGISSQAPGLEPLLALVSKHFKPLLAPWLVPHLSHPSAPPAPAHLIPTHVKHLRSSAPFDPRASNALKKADRKAKKRGTNKTSQVYVAED